MRSRLFQIRFGALAFAALVCVADVKSAEAPHWAFVPPRRAAVPEVGSKSNNPIDSFIRHAQAARNVSSNEPADRRTLLRRLSFDLIGLPPTAEEIDAFVCDTSADAYARQVERLLRDPRHGERWGRHWLDVARYADSEGYESDHIRPYAWRYRDYVVKSFRDDKPFDRFLTEQIAGDELLPYSDDNLIATGFLASARLSSNEEDRHRQRNDVLVDIVNATGAAFMGLTINCAQCHKHKFDPITAQDYYRLQGFFVKGMPNNLALRDEQQQKAWEAQRPADYEPAVQLRDALLAQSRLRLSDKARERLSPEQKAALAIPTLERNDEQERLAREAALTFEFAMGQIENGIRDEDRKLFDELKKKIAEIEKKLPDRPQTFGFYSPVTSPTKIDVLPMKGFYPPPYDPKALAEARSHLLHAGDVHRRGPVVDVGWPGVFGPTSQGEVANKPRSALAAWMTRTEHPLTARVWVNRIWQYHFGRGLVTTPNDFGVRGEKPTHPELLDWMATELVRSGWSTRHIHRLIVMSETYRQSSARSASNAERDPDNLLWWRWQPRRLEVEAIRDSMLAVSGELDKRIGGAPDAEESKSVRRTIYLLQKRQKPPAVQGVLDGPTAATESCAKRPVSTVPLQALYLLNNEFSVARAKKLAELVRETAGNDSRKRIDAAFRLTLGRVPDDVERAAAARLLDSGDSLVLLCQALMNANEFVYME